MSEININSRPIGQGHPPYIVAEMSANHLKTYETAAKILEVAKACGADAVKLQTYTPDTLTIRCSARDFLITNSPWQGKQLYDLYEEAYMPWEWQPRLKERADRIGLDLFSTPFDSTAVEFLEKMAVPAHKIASFELTDLGLLKKVGATGKPVILSTGLASLREIEEAVNTLKASGCNQLALLKCTSAYPADEKQARLKTIPYLSQIFKVPAGLSDHTTGSAVAVAAVAVGANIIEKHFTLDKNRGPDASFSMTPDAFKKMVRDIRKAYQALGEVDFSLSEQEKHSLIFRRSLYIVEDVPAGAPLTSDNVRSIRPGYGLAPRHLDQVLGRKVRSHLKKGTPLSWDLLI